MEKEINITGNNVYPFNRTNFDALINYYFIKNNITIESHRSIEEIYSYASQIELFEFEYIVKFIIGHLDFFKEKWGNGGLTVVNLCIYGLDAYMNSFKNGSFKRNIVTKSFQELLIKNSN